MAEAALSGLSAMSPKALGHAVQAQVVKQVERGMREQELVS